MDRSTTSDVDDHDSQSQYPTPIKAKIQGAVEFCDRMNLPYYKEDVFRTFNVSREQGYAFLRTSSSRRLNNDPDKQETRGRKSIITPRQIREMERILESEGIEARGLTWEQLGYEIGLECSARTIKRTMGTMDYHKCIACKKGWVGKMSQRVYIDQVLEPIIKPWIEMGHDFVLEKNGNSGHGPGKSNIVKTWKENNQLKYYFNCPFSFDLFFIENCWQPPKQQFKKYPHWDDATTKKLIYEGWSNVSQRFINEKVITMPDRLQAVIDGEGKMTGY